MDETVQTYFNAMQRGSEGEDELLALFADDAVYQEPFGRQTLEGRDAIAAWVRASREQAPPELVIEVERIDVVGEVVEATWTCDSPIFARPTRGRDRFTIRAGKIARLESEILQPPVMRGEIRDS
jgi:ketosteroid isomerase-like protein